MKYRYTIWYYRDGGFYLRAYLMPHVMTPELFIGSLRHHRSYSILQWRSIGPDCERWGYREWQNQTPRQAYRKLMNAIRFDISYMDSWRDSQINEAEKELSLLRHKHSYMYTDIPMDGQ